MSFIKDFVAELRPLVPEVGTRTFPLIDKGTELPSIVYNSRGLVGEAYVKDSVGLVETFIQLDVYSVDYEELDTLRTAITNHFNGFTGTFNSTAADGGTIVSSCSVITTREFVESQNPVVYRANIELNILSA